MNVAIIGCGLIGGKRAAHLGDDDRLVAVCDVNETAMVRVAGGRGCVCTTDWRAVVARGDVEAVIVATPHDLLAPITLAAIQAGKHVLVEKPAARRAAELAPVCAAWRAHAGRLVVKVGFNHRFHPAMQKARELIDRGVLGPLMFLRGRYGHGGRLGYEKEWRAQPDRSGGGELLDQGTHLIDLSRWYLGELRVVTGLMRTYFWQMPVEDNAFLLLETAGGQIAQLHVSWTEWKNLFSLEIYGRDGKLHIEGLGGSYGVERLAHYAMGPEMGPPTTTIYEYPGADVSWQREYANFKAAVMGAAEPLGTLEDAYHVLCLVDAIYQRRDR
ncbi:MAG: Gfo/Idh/MocA family oxidoreductase [bacterium]|nr:Gfo/Idh/MocA family oxidoreductase [bacterium]